MQQSLTRFEEFIDRSKIVNKQEIYEEFQDYKTDIEEIKLVELANKKDRKGKSFEARVLGKCYQ